MVSFFFSFLFSSQIFALDWRFAAGLGKARLRELSGNSSLDLPKGFGTAYQFSTGPYFPVVEGVLELGLEGGYYHYSGSSEGISSVGPATTLVYVTKFDNTLKGYSLQSYINLLFLKVGGGFDWYDLESRISFNNAFGASLGYQSALAKYKSTRGYHYDLGVESSILGIVTLGINGYYRRFYYDRIDFETPIGNTHYYLKDRRDFQKSKFEIKGCEITLGLKI